MHSIDWLFVATPILLVVAFAIYTHRYVRSVADFLSGGRCAGRYLLANARGESDSGLANTMSKFEVILVSGFVLNFWEKISVPVILLIGITGFVVYRFRETRALTLAQFLEARYSRAFRLYMGALAFLSGILNYGIFPAVSARFFIYFLDLPQSVSVAGVNLSTMALIMLGYLACTVFMILVGGQVTLMVTDCIEGILSHAIYIVIVIAVFFIIDWSQVVEVMSNAAPGYSHIDPFDAYEVEDFNIWYIVMALLINVYTTMALQNKQGFNSAAKSAHESRMGHVLGHWRTYARMLMILLLGVCALTFMDHPSFASQAAPIREHIGQIQDGYLKKQMTVPIALSYLLPIGIKGLFVAMMLMGLLAGDSGHMHSWGSILVQDVILPLRKKPMSTRGQIWALRLSIASVATFAFCFSLFFQQTQYIALWWALTAGVFTAGAGAVIIGGLYWRKGTTAGAWAGAITGSALALIGIPLTNRVSWGWITGILGPTFAEWGMPLPERFGLNGIQVAFIASCAAFTVYILVSLLTCRQDYNLDRLLHRGPYALPGEKPLPPLTLRQRFTLQNIFKFDANFTFWDKLVSGGIFWWAMLLLAINLVITFWNLFIFDWPVSWWAHYWMITAIAFPLIIAVATLVWFSIGGVRDIIDFFRALATMQRDVRDDGRVEGGHPAPVPAVPVGASDAQTKTEPSDVAAVGTAK
ncbi:sodium:solute symporter family protein [Fontivita pretiosa]|uniref:sodium:solute symporter family protein n=1 Tax=Fontivita pretiosa TaxID=2989684 RepID=UPI003D17E25D